MYKDNVLTIADWTKGMADSAYTGFSTVANMEVFETPGVLKITNRTLSKITTSLTGMPIAYVEDKYGNYYFLTSDGKCYKNDGTVLQSSLANPWDLVVYNDYLIVSNSTVLNAYGPLSSGGAQWFGNWKTGLNGSYYGKLLPARDGNLYIGNGEYVAKVSAFVAGAVGVAPTATFSTGAMLLPNDNAVTTMVEIGAYALIGTQALNGSWSTGTSGNVANLYLWDKSDTKPISLVGSLNESAIQSMISIGNRAYFIAGTRGNLYVTDTTSFAKARRIPWNQNRLFGATMRCYPNAMSVNIQGNLLIGTSTLADAYGSTASAVRHGVYEVALSKDYPTVFKQQISTGNYGQTQNLKIGFVFGGTGTTIIGWQDGSAYGMDTTDFQLYANSVATAETQLFYIATRLNRKTFQHLEFLLGKPLTVGQEITLSYRKNLTDSYTAWKSYTYTNLGSVISHTDKAALDEIELLQIKIQLTQPATAESLFGTNIELFKLTIW